MIVGTPRRWRFVGVTSVRTGRGHYVFALGDSEEIVFRAEMKREDAFLAGAAPDLLAAAEMTLAALTENGFHGPCCQALRDAIARAKPADDA